MAKHLLVPTESGLSGLNEAIVITGLFHMTSSSIHHELQQVYFLMPLDPKFGRNFTGVFCFDSVFFI